MPARLRQFIALLEIGGGAIFFVALLSLAITAPDNLTRWLAANSPLNIIAGATLAAVSLVAGIGLIRARSWAAWLSFAVQSLQILHLEVPDGPKFYLGAGAHVLIYYVNGALGVNAGFGDGADLGHRAGGSFTDVYVNVLAIALAGILLQSQVRKRTPLESAA